MVTSKSEIKSVILKVLDNSIVPPKKYSEFKYRNNKYECTGCTMSHFEQDVVKEHMVSVHKAGRTDLDWKCLFKAACPQGIFKTKDEMYVHLYNNHYCSTCKACYEVRCYPGHHAGQ